MTTPPPGLLLAVRYGIAVVVDGDNLRLITPVKPSAEVLATLAEDKTAIIAYLQAATAPSSPAAAGPLPRALGQVEMWRASFARLSPQTDPCPGWRPGEWERIHAAIATFLDPEASPSWPRLACERRWDTLSLFSIDARVGAARVDRLGALLVSGGVPVIMVSEVAITFANGLCARRVPIDPATCVPVWDFAHGERDA